jgi:4-diphosphocytidyl-2-C-methyl-D-erythritol kinase
MTASLQVRSYAKINWALEVLNRREDGYHELRTIYQTVSLHDTIRFAAAPGRVELTCDDSRVPQDESNLAVRAALKLRELAGTTKGARIQIRKRIPVAAGLGGGSSNAAVSLVALRELWGIGAADRELEDIAASLGSDVPFFLMGGTALGLGRGEAVQPMEELDCSRLLLVNPGFPVSTRDAYERLSRLTRPVAAPIIPFTLTAANGISGLPLSVRNDLEVAVLPVHPEIAEVKRVLVRMGARLALMSGSGATVFGVFDNSEVLEESRAEVRAKGYWSESVRTINRLDYRDTIFE